jgi:hypothetical protein
MQYLSVGEHTTIPINKIDYVARDDHLSVIIVRAGGVSHRIWCDDREDVLKQYASIIDKIFNL